MAVDYRQFRDVIVEPTLRDMGLHSDDAVAFLMHTAAIESNGGTYLRQIKGPARGPWQMEPGTLDLITERIVRDAPGWTDPKRPWTDYIMNTHNTADVESFQWDLRAACAYARALLRFDPHPIGSDDATRYMTYRRVWRPGRPQGYEIWTRKHREWKAGRL